MPYIAQNDRQNLNPHLNQIINLILSEKSRFSKAEILGSWVQYILSTILYEKTHQSTEATEVAIETETNGILNYILEPFGKDFTENQLFSLSGNLNYCISYVTWAILGDHKDTQKASYGMRCYTAQQIRNSLTCFEKNKVEYIRNSLGHFDKNKIERLSSILQGVINDVLDELYRRKTSVYEDIKRIENGDLEY